MIALSPILCKLVVGGAACSVVAGGTVVGYIYKDQIFRSGNTEYVYVAVRKNSTITASSDVGNLTTTSTDNKITKNYQCKLTVDSTDYFDKNCTVIKWNQEPIKNGLADKNSTLFKNSITSLETLKASDTALLKISKHIYSKLNKSSNVQDISIVKKDDPTKVFGAVNWVFDINKDYVDPITSVTSNLFLMRITEAATTPTLDGGSTNTLKCKIDTNEAIDCKIYKVSGKNDSNNIPFAGNTELAAFADADRALGKYVVVDLMTHTTTVEALKNKKVVIYKTDTTSESNKYLTATVDQILFKNAALTTNSVYPLSPRYVRYAVKKATGAAFTDIATSTTKNYKCQFTDASSNLNEDFSCLLQALPATSGTTKIHPYASILKPTPDLTGVDSTSISKDHFVLTVNANLLFNLKPDWTTPSKVVVVKTTDTTDTNKTASFELLHELTDTQATGYTNLALVKYKSTVTTADSTWAVPTGKCALSITDSTGFGCTFKKTKTPATPSKPYTDLEFNTTDESTFATGDHFALVSTDLQKIADFADKTILYHTTSGSTSAKYTFDLVALMGGEVGTDKIPYFLEEPRLIGSENS